MGLPKIDFNFYNKYDKNKNSITYYYYECRYPATMGDKQLIHWSAGGGCVTDEEQ